MKIRSGFISNSSSSSFIITNPEHEGLKKLIDYIDIGEHYYGHEYEIDMESLTAYDIDDNAIWWISSEYLEIDHEEFLEEIGKY
jgi:hypothetical protein